MEAVKWVFDSSCCIKTMSFELVLSIMLLGKLDLPIPLGDNMESQEDIGIHDLDTVFLFHPLNELVNLDLGGAEDLKVINMHQY